jgi:hypothetical protein
MSYAKRKPLPMPVPDETEPEPAKHMVASPAHDERLAGMLSSKQLQEQPVTVKRRFTAADIQAVKINDMRRTSTATIKLRPLPQQPKPSRLSMIMRKVNDDDKQAHFICLANHIVED